MMFNTKLIVNIVKRLISLKTKAIILYCQPGSGGMEKHLFKGAAAFLDHFLFSFQCISAVLFTNYCCKFYYYIFPISKLTSYFTHLSEFV